MAILSNLLAVSQPTGFWETIIGAFTGVTGNYVLAVIFLTVVIRVIWAIIDTYSKYNQQKMNAIQANMQPELDKIRAKYEKSPEVMNQKSNEVYRKYMNRSYYMGCLATFLIMALNMLVFFTLLSGLNSMASHNTYLSYNNLKNNYANSLNVIQEYLGESPESLKLENFVDYENLGIIVSDDEQTISLVKYQVEDDEYVLDENGKRMYNILQTSPYMTDFGHFDTTTRVVDGQTVTTTTAVTNNDYIISLINNFFPIYNEGDEEGSKEVVLVENYQPILDDEGNPVLDDLGNPTYTSLYLSTAVQYIAMDHVTQVYDIDKDSFLWIENFWLADSPTVQSIMSYDTLSAQVGGFDAREQNVYNAFMNDLNDLRGRVNGYYILPILCILISSLSVFLNNLHTKRRNKKLGKENVKAKGMMKWMPILIPVLLGLFALFYSSVFAIYMLTGQIVSTILLPLQLYIVDKLTNNKKTKEESQNMVDYSRKF